MSEFKVNKDSWHYRWLKFYNSFSSSFYEKDYLPLDFCSYWRAVLLWPLMRVGFNAALNLFIVAAIFIMFFKVTAGTIALGGFLLAGVMLIVILALISGLSSNTTKKIKNVLKNADDDSFIGTLYKTHSEKICKKVKYDA